LNSNMKTKIPRC